MEVWIVQHHIDYEGSEFLGAYLNRKDAEEYVHAEMNQDYYIDATIDETNTTIFLKYGYRYTIDKVEVI